MTVTGAASGPTVRVLVGRTEREKAFGIDEQLVGLPLIKGRLIIETFREGKPIEPDGLAEAPALELVLIWPPPVKDAPREDGKRPVQRPQVAATDPAKVERMIKAAIGDSLSQKALDLLKVTHLEMKTGDKIEIRFPAPQSGVSKARQFRISRRLAAELLAGMGMIDAPTTVWPADFPPRPLI